MSLHGARIVVTRPREQAGPMVARLRGAGATVLELPTITFQRITGPVEALPALAGWDTLLLTSPTAVGFFVAALNERGLRLPATTRIACVGSVTAAALAQHGLVADVVPERFVAEGLIEALGTDLKGRRFLFPRAEVAREVLPEALRAAGAEVQIWPLYRTVSAPRDAVVCAQVAHGVDMLTFTAASTVEHFQGFFKPAVWAQICAQTPAACIGPICAKRAVDLGLRVAVVPATYTVDGLVDALVEHPWSARPRLKEA